MNWFIYFLIGAAVSAAAGFFYGKNLLKQAEVAARNKMIPSCNDTIRQAEAIAKYIKERAVILGNSALTWDIKHKNKYIPTYLFDYDEKLGEGYGPHTRAFLKGDSVKLLKFIRWCHYYGCSIVLRQIGQKTDVTEGKGNVIFLSKPDIRLFK